MDIDLESRDGTPCPANEASYCFGERELRTAQQQHVQTDDAYDYVRG